MRIIAGTAKGRKLDTPAEGTRPMTGRAREAIFSMLGASVRDASVLDLFAGSGSMGLEALSRGAADATFVESAKAATTILRANIERVGLGGTVLRSDANVATQRLEGRFDLVFVDPPYAARDESVAELLARLDGLLRPHGVVVVHRHASSDLEPPDFLTCTDRRRYGDAVITFLERSRT